MTISIYRNLKLALFAGWLFCSGPCMPSDRPFDFDRPDAERFVMVDRARVKRVSGIFRSVPIRPLGAGIG